MVRGTDAFLGIYPLPGAPDAAPTQEEMRNASRYFRLELDLAARSGRPALVCYDQRYKILLKCPESFAVCAFDPQEILVGKAAPSALGYGKTFADFCKTVKAAMAYRSSKGAWVTSPRVGVLLPPARYEDSHLAAIDTLLDAAGYEPVKLRWPPMLDRHTLNTVATLDWMLVDVGDPDSAAAAAFLHGQFVPALRLKRIAEVDVVSALERTLYGGIEVGYGKDIVRWRTAAELGAGIANRIEAIDRPVKRISKRKEAEDYFRSPALRKEEVFVSYSGEDGDAGARISAALKKRFEKVFDYKDGESIRPGHPWLDEIFEKLSSAAVVIPLLSQTYFESGNCLHEAKKTMELYDSRKGSKKLRVIPVKITDEKLTAPPWFTLLQYERSFSLDNDPDALAQRIVDLIKSDA